MVRMSLMPAASTDGTNSAAGDNAGTGSSGLEQNAAGTELADDLVREWWCPSETSCERGSSWRPRCPCGWRPEPRRPCRGRSPRVPLPSPTTTRAANLKMRPPLTVLDTRLSATTFSVELVLALLVSVKSEPCSLSSSRLELQAALTGAICERLHAAVVHIAAAVEHDSLDAGLALQRSATI